MKMSAFSHPLLSCGESKAFESSLLGDEGAEWAAMCRAGAGLAEAIIRDYGEAGEWPRRPRIVALIGKGHNGGDVLLACGRFLEVFPRSRIALLLTCGAGEMKPLANRAYERLEGRVAVRPIVEKADAAVIGKWLDAFSDGEGVDLCLDGLLGASFRPPVREPLRALIRAVNGYGKIRLRAAADLPSGRGDAADTVSFDADFTYATGIPKYARYADDGACGRLRFVDLGFFDKGQCIESSTFLLNDRILEPLRKLRPAGTDKRSFGHLHIVGGSAGMPGALLMAVGSAVRSGIGLVTVYAPASLVPVLAVQVPEAMWVPWPETERGQLDSRAAPHLFERMVAATCVLIGPGMGMGDDTEAIGREAVARLHGPVVCDADALRGRVVAMAVGRPSGAGPVVLTPHKGEYLRMVKTKVTEVSEADLRAFCQSHGVMAVLKGPTTRICDGETVLLSGYGGPVLARGGSGDILAGLIGGILGQDPKGGMEAVARAVVWHGLAAERLARRYGQASVRTTQMFDFLTEVLRPGSETEGFEPRI